MTMTSVLLASLIAQAPGAEERKLDERTYLFHLGKDAKKPAPDGDAARRPPLVLVFHGMGSNGRQAEVMTGFDEVADAQGFAVAYPDGERRVWRYQEKSPDVEFTSRLIDALVKSGEADPARVYATGLSNGAYFCNRLACDLSDKLAAIAPVAGTIPKLMAERMKPPRPMPVLCFHGTEDAIVGIDGTDAFSKQQASLGAEELARFWATSNHSFEDPALRKAPLAAPLRVELEDKADDGTTVERLTWDSKTAPVVFCKVIGGGHTWPGSSLDLERLLGRTTRDLSASEEIWTFFARFTRTK
jgi:polyhydroxybutyrate depolymerase